MDIRNWEFYDSGDALVGATVKARDAILTHPNAGTVLATTTTDNNGAWAFTGLTDTAKDVEVIWGNVSQYHKWYKGFTRHGTGVIFFEEPQEFKQVASLGTAAGAGSSIFGFKTDGEPIFRSGAGGAETKIATFTGATGVLRAAGWGTVDTADITANATTQSFAATPTTVSPTTTSTTPVDLAEMSVSPTTTGGPVFVSVNALLQNSGAGNVTIIDLLRDGTLLVRYQFQQPVAGYQVTLSFSKFFATTAAAHTFKLQWSVTAGTATAIGTSRDLSLVEFKR